ncbi:MAG: TIGR00341 family protein [Gammaproteobacteria bacterium]|nr:MAG: TIGR00341 family protein [Gammaproteobacteria bacterium]
MTSAGDIMWEKLKEWRMAGADLTPTERREVLEELFVFGKDNQLPFYKRMAYLLIVSTIIACCGLMADSAAVVIGAMLVAPMMRPVMISAAAITLGWSHYLYQALVLTLIMALSAVGIAALFAQLSPQLIEIPGQVMARTEPTFFDLVIALAAGSGGAYTMTHKESSAIPGVAMAVALLPPLASTGILLVFQENDLALKAFILFFTNFAAMVLAATLTFLYLGISPRKTRTRSARSIRNYLTAFFLLVVGVSIPLYFFSTEVWYDATYKANQTEELQAWLKENELLIDAVQIDEEQRIIFLELLGPNPPLSVETLHNELKRAYFVRTGLEAKPFSIQVLWTQTAEFSWPPVSMDIADERVLEQDYTAGLLGYTWYWVGTQYANGDWLRPKATHIRSYSISPKADASVELNTHCAQGRGSYELSQEDLSTTFDTAVADDCETSKIDARFITDLNNAINVEIEGDHMILRLGSDIGVMHFQSVLPQ